MYRLSKRSKRNLEGVKPVLVSIFTNAVKSSPYDYGIPNDGGLRTAEEQNILYLKGLSQRDGYNKLSKHQTGEAVDIFPYIDGRANYNYDILEKIANYIRDFAECHYGVILLWLIVTGKHINCFTCLVL